MIIICSHCWAENRSEEVKCCNCGQPLDFNEGSYVSKLINALHHPLPEVASRSAWVLGELHEKRSLVALFEVIVNREDPLILEAAVEALGKIGDPSAIPILTNILKKSYLRVRVAAIEALANIGTDAAIKIICGHQYSKIKSVRDASQKALFNFKEKQ